MRRLPDWENRLVATMQSLLGQPYVYGQMDCQMVCLAAIDALLGTDELGSHQGLYRDRMSGLRYLRQGGESLRGVLVRLRAVSVAPLHAQTGDILLVLARDDQGKIRPGAWQRGHVVLGDMCMSATTALGVVLLPVPSIMPRGDETPEIWRIG